MASTELTAEQNAGVAKLLGQTLNDALELARAEVALAKQDLVGEARSLGTAAVLLVAAGFVFQAALTTLGVMLVLMLHATATAWAVVGGFLVVALLLAASGGAALKRNSLAKLARVKTDVQKVAAAAK